MTKKEHKPDLQSELGISRRDLIRRGAIAGGTLLWAAPVISSIRTPAYAASPIACAACLSATFDPPGPPPPVTTHITFNPTPQCCACITANGGGVLGVVICAINGSCTITGPPQPGPCP
jgi:hypothetical protein